MWNRVQNDQRSLKKYGVPRNTIPTWLLPENKDKIKSAFHSGELSTKRKILRGGSNENLDKVPFDWFKRMRMNNLPISPSQLKAVKVGFVVCKGVFVAYIFLLHKSVLVHMTHLA